jgi:hypothetical protein
MSALMKWEKARPDNFYRVVSHLWLQHDDGRIEVCQRRRMDESGEWADEEGNWELPGIHADHWGELAWETPCRGYFSAELGIVAAHVGLERRQGLLDQLARKFKDAIYYCD